MVGLDFDQRIHGDVSDRIMEYFRHGTLVALSGLATIVGAKVLLPDLLGNTSPEKFVAVVAAAFIVQMAVNGALSEKKAVTEVSKIYDLPRNEVSQIYWAEEIRTDPRQGGGT